MPNLDDILKDTLVKIGAEANLAGLTEFEPGIDTLAHRPMPNNLGPDPQPIWVWDYIGVREINQAMPMNAVQELEVWSRTVAAGMPSLDMGWMTAASPVVWRPVEITLPQEKLVLPLTQKYFVKGLMLSSGTNTGANAWWPLPATLDQSFASVFAYDLTSRQQFQPPAKVDAARFNSPAFMPEPNVESGNLPVGSTGVTEDRHLICVVLSLVCMQERADFEPGGIVGMGRFYPHFMIMSNKRLDGSNGIAATITVTRPDRSGYYGTFMNPGGAPRIMSHPDLDPNIRSLLVTEPNVARGVDPLNLMVLPYWDLMFDYFLPIEYSGGATGLLPRNQKTRVVDRGMAGRRTMKGILQHLDYSKLLNLASAAISNPLIFPMIPPTLRAAGGIATQVVLSRPSLQGVMFGNLLSLLQIGKISKSDFLPRIKTDLVKLPGQGTFDNVHISPGMKADKVIGTPPMADPSWQSSLDTLDKIKLAPFCDHDCMHTHWRWGAAFKNHPAAPNQQPLRGFVLSAEARFSGTGKPYQEVGSPMAPLNQNVDIAFGSNQQLVYSAEISNAAPGVWQPVYHHGSAYALGFSTIGVGAHALAKQMVGGSQEDSELYWNMRYQASADGALERVVLDPFDLQRAMTAANTVRLHLKVFEEPVVPIEAMLANAKALLGLHNIDLIEVSRETFTDLDEIARFRTLAVDPNVPTDDQTALFNFRGDAEPDDLVIYFVRTIVPTQAGCAMHPPDKPGAIVAAAFANIWTLAHQIGHVLGLDHVDGINRLMTRRSASTIEAAVPEIIESEVTTMMDSPFNKV